MVRNEETPQPQQPNSQMGSQAPVDRAKSRVPVWLRQGLQSVQQDLAGLSELVHQVQLSEPQQIAEGVPQSVSHSVGTSGNAPVSHPSHAPTHSPRITVTQPPSPPSREPQSLPRRSWGWQLTWLAMLGVFGGVGTAALIWLTSLPPLPDCKQTSRMTADAERLYCAQQAAESGELSKLVTNIDTFRQWGPDHELYSEATRNIDRWSAKVLAIAKHKLESDDFKGALAAIRHIPKTSSVYDDAQELVGRWQKHWRKGAELYAKSQTAMRRQRWDDASQYILELTKFDVTYWSDLKATELAQQLGVERQARQSLTQAQKLARGGKPEDLGAAIVLAQKVPDKTFAFSESRTSLKIWSEQLLNQGLAKWEQGDRKAAIALLQLPPIANPMPEVQDIVRFGNAYRLVDTATSTWMPSFGQIWNLMEATAAIEQVPADSQFRDLAQLNLKQWRAHLKDVVQLQFASLTASLGPQAALQLAIEQAQMISPQHPRRLQAQTLVAFWAQEVERIEDRPLVARAKEMAKSGQITDLKAAIAEANQINQGRKLRGEAQDLIASWQSQIEIIEDQPVLDSAYALASQGKLEAAIDTAAKIGGDRALYGEAQSAIGAWEAEIVRAIQIAQDQPLLDRAYSLADQGSLSAAIDVASQIGYGRVLSGEAQGAIDRWAAQLAPPPVENTTPASAEPATTDSTEPEALSEPEPTWMDQAPALPSEGSSPTYYPPAPVINDPPARVESAPPLVIREEPVAPEPIYVPPAPVVPEPAFEPPAPVPEPIGQPPPANNLQGVNPSSTQSSISPNQSL